MNKLVIYDSLFGNTKQAAEIIGEVLAAKVLAVDKINLDDIKMAKMIIVGSPTHGGQPKATILKFLNELPLESLNDKKVAVFDTRLGIREQKIFLRWLMKLIGYAGFKMERILAAKGGQVVAPALELIVASRMGPLAMSELAKARNWAKQIA